MEMKNSVRNDISSVCLCIYICILFIFTIGYPCWGEGLLAPPCRMGLLPKWCFEKYSFIFLFSRAATDLDPLLPIGPPVIPPPPSSALRFLFLSEGVLGTFSGVFGSTSLSLCDEPSYCKIIKLIKCFCYF